MPELSPQLLHDLFVSGSKDLVRYLRSRIPRGEDARDLAQEAYLRLSRFDRGDLVRNPEAYLFRIASNLIYEHWLKHRGETAAEEVNLDSLVVQEPSPDEQVAQSEALSALFRVLKGLPPMYQQVVLMHRRDGMTYEEIAAELGISSHMVKKHLSRALALCRTRLRAYQDE